MAENQVPESQVPENQTVESNGLNNNGLVLEQRDGNQQENIEENQSIVVPRGKENFIKFLSQQADFSHLNPENVVSKGENVEDNKIKLLEQI